MWGGHKDRLGVACGAGANMMHRRCIHQRRHTGSLKNKKQAIQSANVFAPWQGFVRFVSDAACHDATARWAFLWSSPPLSKPGARSKPYYRLLLISFLQLELKRSPSEMLQIWQDQTWKAARDNAPRESFNHAQSYNVIHTLTITAVPLRFYHSFKSLRSDTLVSPFKLHGTRSYKHISMHTWLYAQKWFAQKVKKQNRNR